MVNIYESPEYWCGEVGYRPPGYSDFIINLMKELYVIANYPESVLDIGCAYGFSVCRLRLLRINAFGIDISNYALSKAYERVKPFLKQGDVCELPYKDKEFDFILCTGVLEHLTEEQLNRAIPEILRVSHRGVIGVSCKDDPTTHEDDDKTHCVILTRKEWQEMFPPQYKVISDSTASWMKNTYSLITSKLIGRGINFV